jgi:DnaJ-class molecular chaperone
MGIVSIEVCGYCQGKRSWYGTYICPACSGKGTIEIWKSINKI